MLLVTTGSTFSSLTPTTAWSAPNETWLLSFDVISTPAVTTYTSGHDFNVPFTNMVYLLNGSAVSGPAGILFFNSSASGGFSLCFTVSTCSSGSGFVDNGSQYYTGSESGPAIDTVTSSAYSSANFCATASINSCVGEPNGAITIIIDRASSTPEPSTFPLAFAGAAWLALKRKRGRVGDGDTLRCDPLSPRRTGQADFPATGSPENLSSQARTGSCAVPITPDAAAQNAAVARSG
jgi:hypothetical protein